METRKASPSGAIAIRLIDLTATAIHRIGPWLAAAWLLRLLHELVLAAAGTDDPQSAWITFFSGASRTRVFAFVFGVLGALYGLRQRELRHSAESRLKTRVRLLERQIEDLRQSTPRENA